MADPEHPLNSDLIRRAVVAWVVAIWAVAIAAFLLVFHAPLTEGYMAPQWHQPPVAGAEAWGDRISVRRGTEEVLPQSGSSTAPETLPDRR
jgi:hypothetical protein